MEVKTKSGAQFEYTGFFFFLNGAVDLSGDRLLFFI